MGEIVKIKLYEPIQLDQVRLDSLYTQLGAVGAETVVCRAMEELAVRMAECDTLWREANHAKLRKHVRSLVAISEQLGMKLLAQSATNVSTALETKDETSVAATLSRMLRIGEWSLSAIWAMEDLSI